MALTLEEANRMVQAAISKAKEMNINMSIAVCDAGGHLLAFNRMETCIWISSAVAQGKATAAVGFGRPSGAIQADSPVIQTIMATQGGRMLAAQGGRADLPGRPDNRVNRRQWRYRTARRRMRPGGISGSIKTI